jgi:hypothetical protein
MMMVVGGKSKNQRRKHTRRATDAEGGRSTFARSKLLLREVVSQQRALSRLPSSRRGQIDWPGLGVCSFRSSETGV